jgi:hypothetical protein
MTLQGSGLTDSKHSPHHLSSLRYLVLQLLQPLADL